MKSLIEVAFDWGQAILIGLAVQSWALAPMWKMAF